MLVLFSGFIFTPRAVQGDGFASEIGGCCIGDFPVFGAIDMYVVNGNFHGFFIDSLAYREIP